ncbi:MAG: hypothetical protein ACFFD7_14900 [Candidatus Thorarchaeota archaeon]
MFANDFTTRRELSSNLKAKLEVAELILKALKLDYEILPPRTHTKRLRHSKYEKSLEQVNGLLASKDIESSVDAEQLKNDFEARRFWRRKFQRFHGLSDL